MPDETNDTRRTPEVKETILAGGKRKFTLTLEGDLLWALQDYAKANNVSNANALKDLLEFRLYQLSYLPSWWFRRGSIHGTRSKKRG